jgi:hypothetical protein
MLRILPERCQIELGAKSLILRVYDVLINDRCDGGREMTQCMAIRVGEKIPAQYRKMEKSVCKTCDATFLIIHQQALADQALATSQVDILKNILSEEHVDRKFQGHPESYDLDD